MHAERATGAHGHDAPLDAREQDSPARTAADVSRSFSGFHAISTMLNHPRRRPRPIDASSARFAPIGPQDGALSDLPPADTHVLDEYVASLTPSWERFERERERERERREATAPVVRRLPPLSSVPQVFFATDFDLGNPYTFDLVTERYKQSTAMVLDGNSEASQYGVVLNQMLQEKLSYYSDVIEQHLVVEISARSASFFDALATLRALGGDTCACLDATAQVTAHLDAVDAYVARAREVEAHQAKRHRLEAQQTLLTRVQRLAERRDLVRLSVQHGELDNAMALVEDMRASLGDPELQRLRALRALGPQLDEAQAAIAAATQQEFIALMNVLLAAEAADVHVAHADAMLDDVLPEQDTSTAAPMLPDELPRMWALLARCGGLHSALAEHAAAAGSTVTRTATGAVAADAAFACAAEASADAPWDAYTRGAAALLRALLLGARHAHSVYAAVGAAVSAHEALRGASDAVWDACERAAASALAPRTPRLVELALTDFVVYFALAWRYVELVEAGRAAKAVALRSCLLGQAKSYLGHFHRTRIEQAVRAVEEEVWAPAPVVPALTALVAQLCRAADDASEYVVTRRLGREAPAADAAADASARTLALGEQSYFVVRATETSIKLLNDYVRLVANLPMFAAETLSWIVEFLKQFNSRTCQVVLGAGAMRSAGLKNITARHLALASQSLSLMIALQQPLRVLLRKHLTASQSVLLNEFDKLERDFREHQFEIHSKLVAIMADRVQVHGRALAAQDWNAPLQGDVAASQAVQDLVRETGTLHRVMTQYLDSAATDAIVSRVFAEIDQRVGSVMARVDVRTADAHKRLVCDAEMLGEKLHALSGSWKGERIGETLKGKTPPKTPRASLDKKDATSPPPAPLAYRKRRTFSKRPPATASPQLDAIESFSSEPDTRAAAEPVNVPAGGARPEAVDAAGNVKAEAVDAAGGAKAEAVDAAGSAKAEAVDAVSDAKAEALEVPANPAPAPGDAPPPDKGAKSDVAEAPATPSENKRLPRVPLQQRLAEVTPLTEKRAEAPKMPITPEESSRRAPLQSWFAKVSQPSPEKRAQPEATPPPAKDTPTRSTGRVSLQQRLAEAAKRRGSQRDKPRTPSSPTKERAELEHTAKNESTTGEGSVEAEPEAKPTEAEREEAKPGEKPVEAGPEETPAEAVPADVPAEAERNAKPTEAEREEAKPGEKPVEAGPEETPAEAVSADAPAEAEHETKPGEKPVEAGPEETPVEAVSADAPAEVEHEEAKPGEKPVEAGPEETPAKAVPADAPAEAERNAKPTEAEREEAKPGEKPVEAGPEETPAEAVSADAPAEAEHETKPGEKPVETGPEETPTEAVPTDAPAETECEAKPTAAEPEAVPTEALPEPRPPTERPRGTEQTAQPRT